MLIYIADFKPMVAETRRAEPEMSAEYTGCKQEPVSQTAQVQQPAVEHKQF
jgi:hypothetical protein